MWHYRNSSQSTSAMCDGGLEEQFLGVSYELNKVLSSWNTMFTGKNDTQTLAVRAWVFGGHFLKMSKSSQGKKIAMPSSTWSEISAAMMTIF